MLVNDNTSSEYQKLSQALHHENIGLNAAEIHGLLSGIICGNHYEESWPSLLYEITNEGQPYHSNLAKQVKSLYLSTEETLKNSDFSFQLLLPNDESIFAKLQGLEDWVNHFLLGLGMMQPSLGHLKGDMKEAIDDLRNIARLGYEEDDDINELEMAFTEIMEYVRVVAMLCYSEFVEKEKDNEQQTKHLLH